MDVKNSKFWVKQLKINYFKFLCNSKELFFPDLWNQENIKSSDKKNLDMHKIPQNKILPVILTKKKRHFKSVKSGVQECLYFRGCGWVLSW